MNLDPRTKYAQPPFGEQEDQQQPGRTEPMDPRPDHGETTYKGSGRLEGLSTLITEEENCVQAVEKTVAELGGLDVLILNAGVQHERDKMQI